MCGIPLLRQRLRKISLCEECKRVGHNERRRDKRTYKPSTDKAKWGIIYNSSLSEGDYKTLGEFTGEWDYFPSSQGRKVSDFGFNNIGTITDDDLSIVYVDGRQRIKAAIKLERKKKGMKNG